MAESSGSGGGGVPISALSLEQLGRAKESLEQETQHLVSSLQTLNGVRERFLESRRCLEALAGYRAGDRVLVPLTSSLYVEGEFTDTSEVIVDVGTGYFIRQGVGAAEKFMDRKVAFLAENLQRIQEVVNVKKRQQEALLAEMHKRILSQQQQQQQQGQSSQGPSRGGSASSSS
eukprot:RCo051362